MPKLSAYRIDPSIRHDGEWVALGDEFGGIEIRTRGFTDAYTDAKNARLRQVARAYAGDVMKIPTAAQREIVIEAMIAHVLVGVRGAQNDDGSDTTFAQFCDAIRLPDYEDVYVAVVNACAQAGRARAEEVRAAAKN